MRGGVGWGWVTIAGLTSGDRAAMRARRDHGVADFRGDIVKVMTHVPRLPRVTHRFLPRRRHSRYSQHGLSNARLATA